MTVDGWGVVIVIQIL